MSNNNVKTPEHEVPTMDMYIFQRLAVLEGQSEAEYIKFSQDMGINANVAKIHFHDYMILKEEQMRKIYSEFRANK
jgi:hypothetical protein